MQRSRKRRQSYTAPVTPSEYSPLQAIVVQDITEIRASIDRLVQLDAERNAMLAKQIENQNEHLAMFRKSLDLFGKQARKQEEIVEAVTLVVRALAVQTECVNDSFRESVEDLAVLVCCPPKPIPVPQAPPVAAPPSVAYPFAMALELAMAQTETAVMEPAPVEVVETDAEEPVPFALSKRRYRVKYSSKPLKGHPGQFMTSISIPILLWREQHFTKDDYFQIGRENGMVVIRRSTFGRKPIRIGAKTVVFQSSTLGDLNYDRLNVLAGPGEIHL